MKKLLGIVVLGVLWCGTANAGLNEPGTKKNYACTEAGQTGYKKAIAYLKKNQKKMQLFMQLALVVIGATNGGKVVI